MLDRVRTRGRRPSVHLAVWIVVAIALASIATGIAAILTEPALEGQGVLGTVQAVAEYSGTIVGFALLVAAWGMRRGYRLAYLSAVILVILEAVHGVAHSRVLSIPLVVLSFAGLVVLVRTSPRFTRSLSLESTQVGALLAVLGVVAYGTAGSYALRAEFDGVTTVVDALYFTLVTASTVGYGDVHAVSTGARLFVVSLVILGPTAVGVVVGSLVGPELRSRLTRPGRRLSTDGGRPTSETRVVVLATVEEAATAREPLEEATAHEPLACRSLDSDSHLVAFAPNEDDELLERVVAEVVIDPRRPAETATDDASHWTTDGRSANRGS